MSAEPLDETQAAGTFRRAREELARRVRAGECCAVEALRTSYPALWLDAENALDLIYLEYALRTELGQTVLPEEYYERFGAWRERLERIFGIHRVVWSEQDPVDTARATTGDGPGPDSSTSSGRRLGNYELLEEIGRGGMGVVYKARQPDLNRVVALKVILAGEHAGKEQRSRFRREAEAAARLHHPNIVQIHEIGDEKGLLFLSMEYVQGASLEELQSQWYAEGRVGLTPYQAAQLVETLSHATHHAHEHGVIHRDLKPANILLHRPESRDQRSGVRDQRSEISDQRLVITDRKAEILGQQAEPGVGASADLCSPISDLSPKITDFGLAKLLDAAGDPTQSGALLGTPCYMAPEQARGTAGPAADIYGLGVMLYELLTGRVPFRGTTVLETLDQARHVEAAPPSQLQPNLPGDLQTICLKCLAKEPARRYASAADLAEDLRRFRAGESIRARPAGRLERGWRWCRRNPAVAALTAGIALLLLGGTMVAIVLAVWAMNEKGRADGNAVQARENANQERQARALADRRSAEAEKAVEDFLAGMEKHPRLLEADFFDLRKQLLASALPFYEDFVKQKPGDASLEAKRGRAYFRLAMVRNQLGERKQAAADYRQAVAIFRKLAADFPKNVAYRNELAASHTFLAELSGTSSQAEAEMRRALTIYQSLAADFPKSREYRAQQLRRLCDLAGLLNNQGKRAEAEAVCAEALSLHESLAREPLQSPAERDELARIQSVSVAHMLGELGKHAETEPIYRQALALGKSLTERHPKVLRYWQDLAAQHGGLGYALLHTGRRAEAKAEYRQSLKVITELAEKFPEVPYHSHGTGAMLNALADILKDEGELEEARRLYTEAIKHQLVAYRTAPRSPTYARGLRNPYAGLAEIALRRQDHATAAAAARKLAQVRRDTADDTYDAAQLLARCVLLAQTDVKLAAEKRQPLAHSYADQAMSYLQEAARRGLKDAARLQGDQHFTPLRSRADFQTLIAELQQRFPRTGPKGRE